uniref:non-specific serine/threonine protein kinase n=1 Tax=Solanum lycopersicum TaxID=4081 RepID=A0A3Q7G4Q3_SOLLC
MLDWKALYRDILNATEEFDAKYFIGQGGHGNVYKVNLSSFGNVAVKRLHSSFQNTHPKSFINEVRALTGIKHRNIVNLYGYCSKAQHSLWFTIESLNIIKGVAFALSYMHQD